MQSLEHQPHTQTSSLRMATYTNTIHVYKGTGASAAHMLLKGIMQSIHGVIVGEYTWNKNAKAIRIFHGGKIFVFFAMERIREN